MDPIAPTPKPSPLSLAWNDAGLLRDYAARTYGRFILDGGSLAVAVRYRRAVCRLSALTGRPFDAVAADLRQDAAALFAE